MVFDVRCPRNTLNVQQYNLSNNQQSTTNNQQSSLLDYVCFAVHLTFRTSLLKIEWIFGQILFFCYLLISPLFTRSLDVRDRCRVRILPNLRREDHRNIDSALGILALRFNDIMFCVAKPSENSVVECWHKDI